MNSSCIRKLEIGDQVEVSLVGGVSSDVRVFTVIGFTDGHHFIGTNDETYLYYYGFQYRMDWLHNLEAQKFNYCKRIAPYHMTVIKILKKKNNGILY